ncbi:hypothetical protein CU097_004172, partial [Rhizopus azygosporus]
MRSRKDLATDFKNALLELVSLHWVERMAAAEGKEKAGRALLDDNEENEYEKYFECQSSGVRTDLNSRSTVDFECRLWGLEQAVFGCSMNHKE